MVSEARPRSVAAVLMTYLIVVSDVVSQREIVMNALALREGEHVLDVGPGPGLLLRQIAEQVGKTGRAVGAGVTVGN